MGEYASYQGEQIKIGTCENMYYLRAQQIHEIEDYDFSEDVLKVIRFRFPFPDEDAEHRPGHGEPGRGWRVPSYRLPRELSGDTHNSVQFTARPGYLLSIPCPEQYDDPDNPMWVHVPIHDEADGFGPANLRVGRNGFNGHPRVTWQGWRGEKWVTMLTCGSCGAIHRLDTIEDAEPVIEAFLQEAERKEYIKYEYVDAHPQGSTSRDHLIKMASRITAGYTVGVPT